MNRYGCDHKTTSTVTEWDDLLGGEVTRPDYTNWWGQGSCEYGNCTELLCPACGRNQGGWGPVDCPCQDWRPREQRAAVGPNHVKPSALRHGRRPHRRRT